jgi:hypothetical protein
LQNPVDYDEPLFDSDAARNYFRYARGSIRRRQGLVIGVFLLVLLGTLGTLVALPKSYHVEAKLLAQRNAALSVRSDSNGADAPTRAADETVLRHDNLVAMIEATGLVEHYAAHMSPAQRARAFLMGLFQRDWTKQDKLEAMVELLAKQFHVWSNDGTVTMTIDWPDARMAYRLVDYAQESFLEARHIQEVSSTAESVGILQSHAAALRGDVDTAVEAIKNIRNGGGVASVPHEHEEGSHSGSAPTRAESARSRPAEPDPELTKLRVTLEAKRRAVDDLEDIRRRRLSELQGRLLEQRAVYTDNHPTIIDLQQTIASLSKESPQVAGLKKEVTGLRADLDRKAPQGELERGPSTTTGAFAHVPAPPPQLPADILSFERGPPEERDPAMVYARGQLRDAMDKYAALRSQIQAAQIELETTEAAFKYRYAVVTPAQIPKRPVTPNVLLVVLAAMFVGLFVGLLTAVVADVQSGRLIERWQVELVLDRPILGEVGSHALPPRPEL